MILGCTGGARSVHGGCTDMVGLEIIILGVLNVICILSIVSFGLWLRIELANMLELLDERLALALKAAIDRMLDGNIGDFDPPNPIQSAIAQLIQSLAAQKMNTIEAVVTQRGPDGTFEKSID